jgi:ABC-type dipeptide/oligopeptide/nickel transport system permease component
MVVLKFIFKRFVLRTLWIALLATLGIHIFLLALPKKDIRDSRGIDQTSVSNEAWTNQKYYKWAKSIVLLKPQISDAGTTPWLIRDLRYRAFNTLLLCTVAFIISTLMGIFTGTTRAMIECEHVAGPKRPLPSFLSMSSTTILFIFSSIPSYITAYLMFFFIGTGTSMILPVIALVLGSGAIMDVSRLTSNVHSQQLSAKYVENALACGLKTSGLFPIPGYVAWHAFRNSLITILPVTAYRLPLIVSSALLVEIIFGLPGLGEFLLASLTRMDLPMVLTIILISVVFVQICVFFADVLAFTLHPKSSEL